MPEEQFETGGEKAFKRYIILKGLVENSWLKSPKRVIEIAKLQGADGVSTGVNILSDTEVPRDAVDADKNDTWLTKKENKPPKKRSITMKG
jgi:hypothetical protein